ncbi:CD113 [Mytilus edulis]|uniref:PVRL3 n=1 Tax=Mytilus edulis TaxID=6550 RepID=A0A8S3UEQ4_MYTED|nr:CD113 [Mytilus edulis]
MLKNKHVKRNNEIIRLHFLFHRSFWFNITPSPTVNIQRFKSLVLNCSLEKSWTTVAFNLENLNIALFFNKRIGACSNYAEPSLDYIRRIVTTTPEHFYLTINNVTDTYNGKYIECMYTFESEVGRVRTTLNVQYPPDSTPSLTQIPNGPIIEGNTCIGFTYVSQTGNNYAVSVIERVVTKDDNGKECRCIIKHPLLDPDKEVRSTLNVYYAPTILRLQASNGNMVDEHQSVTFQCEVDSNPAPDITWIHSTTGTLLNKVEKVFKSNFTILKTECLQTGTYRCQASNVIGDMSKTVYAEIDLYVLCEYNA